MSLRSAQASIEDSAQHRESSAASHEQNGGDAREAQETAGDAGSGASAGATATDGDELSIAKTLTESEMEPSGSSTQRHLRTWVSFGRAFIHGIVEFRHTFTTSYEGISAEFYDWGRELAHRATFRYFESEWHSHEPDAACQARLSEARQVAKSAESWTDQACDCLDNGGDYYLVKSHEGSVIWEGTAHCRWCARAEAIKHHGETVAT